MSELYESSRLCLEKVILKTFALLSLFSVSDNPTITAFPLLLLLFPQHIISALSAFFSGISSLAASST